MNEEERELKEIENFCIKNKLEPEIFSHNLLKDHFIILLIYTLNTLTNNNIPL
jgi:hypothetical protein